jgi:hypothetical protein
VHFGTPCWVWRGTRVNEVASCAGEGANASVSLRASRDDVAQRPISAGRMATPHCPVTPGSSQWSLPFAASSQLADLGREVGPLSVRSQFVRMQHPALSEEHGVLDLLAFCSVRPRCAGADLPITRSDAVSRHDPMPGVVRRVGSHPQGRHGRQRRRDTTGRGADGLGEVSVGHPPAGRHEVCRGDDGSGHGAGVGVNSGVRSSGNSSRRLRSL